MTTRDRTDIDRNENTTDESLSDSVAEQDEIVGEHKDTTDGISLVTNETVHKNVHPSWTNWPISLGLAGVFVLVSLSSLADLNFSGFLGSSIVTALILGLVYYSRKRSRYIVTDQRVVKNVGLLRNLSGEARIKDIESLATEQGILERLLGKGSVRIDSTGIDGRIEIDGVKNYEQIANEIRELQRKLEH